MSWLIVALMLPIIQPADVCAMRGHVSTGLANVTCIYGEPWIVDLPDRTLRISHDPNWITYVCARCGQEVREPIQAVPDTVVIWRRAPGPPEGATSRSSSRLPPADCPHDLGNHTDTPKGTRDDR